MAAADSKVANDKTPAFYISHGGGPCFFMDAAGSLFEEMDQNSSVAQWYRDFATTNKILPEHGVKGVIIISAHWETQSEVEVYASEHHDLLFDYYGFPQHTYELTWPAKGDPALAQRVIELLASNDIPAKANKKRGYDHGTFVPMKLAYPDPQIPFIQVSLLASLDPATHYKIGQALRPLREQGIVIIGSGSTTHNLSHMGDPSLAPKAKEFASWLKNVISGDDHTAAERADLIIHSSKNAPHFKKMHPRAEHYVPLLVALGAADGSQGTAMLDQLVLYHMSLLGFRFDS